VAGGVSANRLLRQDMAVRGAAIEIPTFVPPLSLSTDNAAMIAAAGLRRLARGARAPADLNADASLQL
jgi:N6-L-threonylcarbamoyladenine synthase